MRINVRFFAILKDRAGVGQMSIELPPDATVASAVDSIASIYPSMSSDLARSAFAVNRSYVPRETSLREGDELALIPPVSGG